MIYHKQSLNIVDYCNSNENNDNFHCNQPLVICDENNNINSS